MTRIEHCGHHQGQHYRRGTWVIVRGVCALRYLQDLVAWVVGRGDNDIDGLDTLSPSDTHGFTLESSC